MVMIHQTRNRSSDTTQTQREKRAGFKGTLMQI